ncbi:MAG: LemA family protein, partial [Planctomycetota bacterium]
ETAKGYMKHERETLEAVTNARNLAQKAVGTGVGAQSKAETDLSGALSRLLAVVENYPDLKANQNMLSMQEELTSTENRIGFARQHYNDTVLKYTNRCQMFPGSIVAGMFGFKKEDYFELDEDSDAREPVKVTF